MTRWEYASFQEGPVPRNGSLRNTVISVNWHFWDFELNPKKSDELLNLMGAEGWELVSIVSYNVDPETNVQEFRLKRERR
jgi:hypothetical protein